MDPLSGSNITLLIGLMSTLAGAYYGFKKYRYEKRLEQFREINNGLFKQEKQEVLAAISAISIFKQDPDFKKNTTDVLLSRLYTELDYDITNAIANTLIQYSNRQELIEIANQVLDINRNFFVQTQPIKDYISDLNRGFSRLQRIKSNASSEADNILEIEKSTLERIEKRAQKEFIKLSAKDKYELIWRKQITADTYGRIQRKAFLKDSKQGLNMHLYQNDFNYALLADFKTAHCSIHRSAISSATIVDFEFNNITVISRTPFNGSYFQNCSFRGGQMKSCPFFNCTFDHVIFEDVEFTDIFFADARFSNVRFINCKGLSPAHFSFAHIDDKNTLPPGITVALINQVTPEELKKIVMASSLKQKDKEYILGPENAVPNTGGQLN